jgi:hypothetical protein
LDGAVVPLGGVASSSSGSSGSGPPPPPPPPPEPPPDFVEPRPRGPRDKKSVPWGPWTIAEIESSAKGAIVGYGVVCGQHLNSDDGPKVQCKRQLMFGESKPISDVECRSRLKAWLLEGLAVDAAHPLAREMHMDILPRRIKPLPKEEELDSRAAAL